MNVKNMANKVGFVLKKNAPDILMGVGIVGFVTSSVLVGKASTKIGALTEELQTNLNSVEVCLRAQANDYSEEDAKKDRMIMYTQSSLKIVKLYAPAVSVGVFSIGCVLKSHNILKNRMMSLSAAYATLAVGYKAYQERVAARYGEEAEKEIRYNISTVKTEETTVNAKGKEKTVVTETKVMDATGISPYAKFFDENNINWEDNPEFNLQFLTAQQRYANDKLKANGYLFLNEVYKSLGFPETKAGQVVGWVWNKNNDGVGDNYVDFGIYDVTVDGYQDAKRLDTIADDRRDFVNGRLSSVLLDFNVDGNVWDQAFDYEL